MSIELKAGDAAVSGQASVIRAADKPKADLQAQPATLRATIHITRAATGKTETYEIVGTPIPEKD
jgi:hypothetical protein